MYLGGYAYPPFKSLAIASFLKGGRCYRCGMHGHIGLYTRLVYRSRPLYRIGPDLRFLVR